MKRFGLTATIFYYLPYVYATLSTQYIVKERDKYPLEAHTVTTSDGYVLQLFRIPFSPIDANGTLDDNNNSSSDAAKPVVLLMHGLFDSSDGYVINGPGRSLAYILSDLGYDVWLANARGNKYSKKNVNMSPFDTKFWTFDWHEIGAIDLPANINYVLSATKEKRLSYVGHSQGGTALLVLASLAPEYTRRRIKSAHLMAPACIFEHTRSPLRLVGPLLGVPDVFGRTIGVEILPDSPLTEQIKGMMCNEMRESICHSLLGLFGGFDFSFSNSSLIKDYFAIVPSGASWKQLRHYAQEYMVSKFQQYDYGLMENLLKYKSFSPPEYPLWQITIPIFFHAGVKDEFVTVEDTRKCASMVRTGNYAPVQVAPFDHLNFLWAWEAKTLVYNVLIKHMQKFIS